MRVVTRLFYVLHFAIAFTLLGCSGSGGEPKTKADAGSRDSDAGADGDSSADPNPGEAVRATIDVEGGTITALGEDGTRYTLTVPAYSLWSATEITLKPLESVDGLPLSAGARAAVEFAPDGLQFLAPAELAVEAPEAIDPAWLVGFSKSGDRFELLPVHVSGDTLRLLVGHFSSAGVGTSNEEELNTLTSGNTSSEQQANNELAAYFAEEAAAGRNSDPAQSADILRGWYEGSVAPGLDAAIAGGKSTRDAVAEYLRWAGAAALAGADGLLESELSEGLAKVATAIQAEIARLNERCAAENNWQLAREVLNWAGAAWLMGLDERVGALDRASILADLCIQVAIEEATLPEELEEDEEATLEVRAGISVGGRPTTNLGTITIAIDAGGTAQVSPASGSTDSNGSFSASVTPRVEAGKRVVLDVTASFPEIPGLQDQVRVEAPVGEAVKVEVAPGEVTVKPGETQQFSATVTGTDDTEVVWNAGGGTITQDGLYEAGKTPGTYRVTATSVVDPEATATAFVTIEDVPMVEPLLRVGISFTSRSAVYAGSIHEAPEEVLFDSYDMSTSSNSGEARLSAQYTYDPDSDTLQSIKLASTMRGYPGGTTAAWGEANFRLLFRVSGQTIQVKIKGTCSLEGTSGGFTEGYLSLRIDNEPVGGSTVFMQSSIRRDEYYTNPESPSPCAGGYERVSKELGPGIYRLHVTPYASTRDVDYDFDITFEPIEPSEQDEEV